MHRYLSAYCISCIALSLLGCQDGDGGGGGSGGTTSQPVSKDITGTIIDIHVTDTNDAERRHNASTASVDAWILGDDGSFTKIAGVIADDGTFVIPDVPQGPYYLRYKKIGADTTTIIAYDLVTSERVLDLGDFVPGRPNAATLQNSTGLSFKLDGLQQPSQFSEEAWFTSAGAGVICPVIQPANGTTLDAGVNLADCNLRGTPFAIDSAAGDRSFVTYLSLYGDPAGEKFTSLSSAFELPSFTVIDGQSASFTGTFTHVPQKPITISMNKSAFVSMASEIHPNAMAAGFSLRAEADVGGQTRATSWAMLLKYVTYNLDTSLTNFQYGNPFPSSWSEGYIMDIRYQVDLGAPNGTGPSLKANTSIGRSGPVSSLATTMFEPVLSPPRDIRINGQSATGTLMGVGTHPTLAWSPPSKGKAAMYEVFLLKYDPAQSSYAYPIEIVYTTETNLTWRATVTSGLYHGFRIRAHSSFNPKAPLKTNHEQDDFADAVTGLLMP